MRHFLRFCVSIGFLLQLSFPLYVSSLECLTCQNSNFYYCYEYLEWVQCADDEVCSTEVRRHKDQITVWSGCKQRKACELQRLQNWARNPPTCNNDQDTSHCWCCCDSKDECNMDEHCDVIANKCPMPSLQIDHGHVTCSNANHLGSLCTYTCNETGYQIVPSHKENRLCLGSGQWSGMKPCCVKECPPYLPVNLIEIVQFNNKESYNKRVAGFLENFRKLDHSKEYLQSYRVFFNEKVYKVVSPDDKNRTGFYQPSVNNTANTAAALDYVYDNILGKLRRRNARDVILIAVEKKSDDDDKWAVLKFLSKRIDIYYVFFQSEGHKIDKNKAVWMSSSSDNIFVGKVEDINDIRRVYNDIFSLACNSICPNAGD